MPEKLLSKTNEFSFTLAPSKIEGVGIFATHNIKKGGRLLIFPEKEKIRFFSHSQRASLDKLRRKFIDRYCPEDKKGYYCPMSFNSMSTGWFLNHSEKPNAFCDEKYNYFAKQNIKKGEEITIDYRKISYYPNEKIDLDYSVI